MRSTLHCTDCKMHPKQRHRHNEEHQCKSCGPDARDLEQCPKNDGKHKTAQTTDHTDQAPYGPHVIRVVNGDMPIHRCLTQTQDRKSTRLNSSHVANSY